MSEPSFDSSLSDSKSPAVSVHSIASYVRSHYLRLDHYSIKKYNSGVLLRARVQNQKSMEEKINIRAGKNT